MSVFYFSLKICVTLLLNHLRMRQTIILLSNIIMVRRIMIITPDDDDYDYNDYDVHFLYNLMFTSQKLLLVSYYFFYYFFFFKKRSYNYCTPCIIP